jgi:hypothetical protein
MLCAIVKSESTFTCFLGHTGPAKGGLTANLPGTVEQRQLLFVLRQALTNSMDFKYLRIGDAVFSPSYYLGDSKKIALARQGRKYCGGRLLLSTIRDTVRVEIAAKPSKFPPTIVFRRTVWRQWSVVRVLLAIIRLCLAMFRCRNDPRCCSSPVGMSWRSRLAMAFSAHMAMHAFTFIVVSVLRLHQIADHSPHLCGQCESHSLLLPLLQRVLNLLEESCPYPS